MNNGLKGPPRVRLNKAAARIAAAPPPTRRPPPHPPIPPRRPPPPLIFRPRPAIIERRVPVLNPPFIVVSGRVPPSIESTTGIWTVHVQFSQTEPMMLSAIAPSTDPAMAMDANLYIAGIYIDKGAYLYHPSKVSVRAYDIATIPLVGNRFIPAGGALNIEVVNLSPDTRGELFLVNVFGQSSGQLPVQVSAAILDLGTPSGAFRS